MGIDFSDSDYTNTMLVDTKPATTAFCVILELIAIAKVRLSLSYVLAKEKYVTRFHGTWAHLQIYEQ